MKRYCNNLKCFVHDGEACAVGHLVESHCFAFREGLHATLRNDLRAFAGEPRKLADFESFYAEYGEKAVNAALADLVATGDLLWNGSLVAATVRR